MKYAVILEKTKDNWGVYAPDLPGCVSTGHTQAEALSNMREALILHLAGFVEDDAAVPDPVTVVEYVEVPVPLNYAQTPGVQVLATRADLKSLRQAAGLTQQDLAHAAGVRQETISRIESGKNRPSFRTLRKVQRGIKTAGRAKTLKG